MSTVDKRLLAEKMLEWEELKEDLDIVQGQISGMVLELEETVVTGNVRATYRKPRKAYDRPGTIYPNLSKSDQIKAALEAYPGYVTEQTTYKVDWVGICKGIGGLNLAFTESDPSVSLKLDEVIDAITDCAKAQMGLTDEQPQAELPL